MLLSQIFDRCIGERAAAIIRLRDLTVDPVEQGRLRLDDPALAGGMLCGMMLMEPQRLVFVGKAEVPSLAEIEERAKACAALFINGCRP